jgi:hypothetical protein
MGNTDNPKVFVSYSHDSDKHKEWILKLCTDLRSHGVDVILDQWDARLGDDLPFFMEQGLSSSNLVLCVCSEKYVEKSNLNKGGVGYEKKILTASLLRDSSINYIIPIKRINTNGLLPIFLDGIKYIDFDNDGKYYENYRELLARIHNEDIKGKPPLGLNPFKSDRLSNEISQNLDIELLKYYNPLMKGNASFDFTNNDGKFIIGTGDYLFTTSWTSGGIGAIYCYKDYIKRLGYNPEFKDFPIIEEISKFNFSSRYRRIKEGEIVILENQYNKFAAIKVIKVSYNSVDIGHILEIEYGIYIELEGHAQGSVVTEIGGK